VSSGDGPEQGIGGPVPAGSLPYPAVPAPSAGMEPVAAGPSSPESLPSQPRAASEGDFPPISGPLRPANEVLLEQLAPTSPVFRRRAFASMLRVLLAGKGE
jgi:hypothetical protein